MGQRVYSYMLGLRPQTPRAPKVEKQGFGVNWFTRLMLHAGAPPQTPGAP